MNCSSFPSRSHCSVGSGPWVGAFITASGLDIQNLLPRVPLSLVILLVILPGWGGEQTGIGDLSAGKRFPLHRLGKITPTPVPVHERRYLCGFPDISGDGISVRDWLPQETEQHESSYETPGKRARGSLGAQGSLRQVHSGPLQNRLSRERREPEGRWTSLLAAQQDRPPRLPPHWPSNPSPSHLRRLSCS